MANLPPLPPGFQLEAGATPPPPGFVLDRRRRVVPPPEINADPMEGTSFPQQIAIGAGSRIADFDLGIRQRLGMASHEDAAEKRRMDAALMDTPGAGVGSLATDLALIPATGGIPGAARVAGSAAIGAGYGAVQPTESAGQTAMNVGLGGALGGAGQAVGQRIAQGIGNRLGQRSAEALGRQEADAVRNQTVRAASEAGYVIPPSTANPSALNRGVESMGGKIATQRQAALANQSNTDRLVRQELGMPDNAPITRASLNGIRREAAQVYRQIENAGEIVPDARYLDDLSALEQNIARIAGDFPDLDIGSRPEIRRLIDGLLVDKFSSRGALELTRTLRAEASGLFKQAGMGTGNPGARALAQATRDAADVVEEQIMRHLRATGGEATAEAFDAARRRIAMTHTVENALQESTGRINAAKLAGDLGRGKPLSGNLDTAARTAEAFPSATRIPRDSPASLVNYGASLGAGGGVGFATGNPLLGLLAAAAIPASRAGARKVALGPLQRNLTPNYGPNKLGTMMLQGSRYPAARGGALAAIAAMRGQE